VFEDGSQTAWRWNDTSGVPVQSMTTQQTWVNRSADLTGFANEVTQGYYLLTDASTPPGSWTIWYSDISIVSADGTVTQIYNREPNMTPAFHYNLNNVATNLSAVSETPSDHYANTANNDTTYYASDQLGTARMEFAGGGWPVWSEDFAPFGQEISPQATPNNYKFTGLERDAEGNSNLDHAQFRQYSSAMGRWISPDPYDGSMDISNPQSLNRYTYVENGPLTNTDPSGLVIPGGLPPVSLGLSTGVIVAAGIGAAAIGVFEIGKDLGWWDKPQYSGDPSEPRPNGHIWDEDQFPIHYGPNIAGALGLPNSGCEFGACGFQPGSAGATVSVASGVLKQLSSIYLFGPYWLDPFDSNHRLFGTHYCGPGGGGDETGTLDHYCHIHDDCYAGFKVSASVNLPGNHSTPLTSAQIAGITGCNQRLSDAARSLGSTYGAAAVNSWLTHGYGFLYPGTNAH
jgi:RHS repeat-associated protein